MSVCGGLRLSGRPAVGERWSFDDLDMESGTARTLTVRERGGLALFVVTLVALAVSWQLIRFVGLEWWVPVAGLAGGALLLPWVWFQTRRAP